MPGGSRRRIVCPVAVICATPSATEAPGWRNTLITPAPLYAVDSICSMSLTRVVIMRSWLYTMRCSTSRAFRPLYHQTTLTTGMLMLREDVRWRAKQHERSQQQKHKRGDHEGVGPA